ncbi:Trypanosome variant surface glycoprotein (A-type), putative [Trypanosoma equiperdum]|uniref:Trypanosome variant surface glycoprotein (A-type), putative n=1 Tax=Trypanosoma equiperdum TaxID=5694 RepID=A0A1G4I9D3_TRYEQ|nr:Trypanosome variant surface glycoprotein (A-type), putative [Trypanosoma equiperdum]
MGGSYHQTAALATTAALLFTTGVKAVGDGIKEAGWKPLCGLTLTVEKAADLAMSQIQQVIAGSKQYTLAALKLQVLSEMGTNQTKQIGYSALAVAAGARADEAMDLLHTLQNEDIPALFYAGDLRGNIGGVLNLIGDAEKTGSTSYCLADATDSARSSDLDTIACGSKYHTVTPKLNKIGSDITPTGFKNVVTTNAITSGGSSDGKCVLTTTPSDATTTFFKTGATRLIMAGTVQITPNDNSGSWQVNGGQPIAESGIARADNLLAKLYNSLQSIQKRDINCCGPATVDDAIKAAASSSKYE